MKNFMLYFFAYIVSMVRWRDVDLFYIYCNHFFEYLFLASKIKIKISCKNLSHRYFVISNALTWVVLILKSGTFSMINCVQGSVLRLETLRIVPHFKLYFFLFLSNVVFLNKNQICHIWPSKWKYKSPLWNF